MTSSHEFPGQMPNRLPNAVKALPEVPEVEDLEGLDINQALSEQGTSPLAAENAESLEDAESREQSGENAPEAPQEKTLAQLETEEAALQERVEMLEQKDEETRAELNAIREKLDLPPREDPEKEKTFSESSNESRQKQLEERLKSLREERDNLMSKEKRDQMIKTEKEKIIQQKVEDLFEEFNKMSKEDIDAIAATGANKEGEPVNSESVGGNIKPEVAQQIAQNFQAENNVSESAAIELFKKMPKLLEEIGEGAEEEAEKIVDGKLAELEKSLDESIAAQEGLVQAEAEASAAKSPEADLVTPDVEKPAEVDGSFETDDDGGTKAPAPSSQNPAVAPNPIQ